MSDIYNLLNLDKGFIDDFHLLSIDVVGHQTEKVVNKNIRQLKVIEDSMSGIAGMQVTVQSIDEVFDLVRKAARNKSDHNFSIKELRIISYYLTKLLNDEHDYNYALDLLKDNWKNMFFNGLLFYVMSSWNYIPEALRIQTCKLITDKLSAYNDGIKRFLMLKDHANLFDENGPRRMAAIIKARNLDLLHAPEILGYKASSLNLSYYSDVIVNFFESQENPDILAVEKVLEHHDLDRTKKLLYALLVEKAEMSGDAVQQTVVSRSANRLLGDIGLSSTWAPYMGATAKEVQRLRNAKDLVNLWMARRTIEVFFEVCVQDPARKTFWLGYVDYVSDFRIVGSTTTKRNIQADSRVGNLISRYFIETNSTLTKTAALILSIKNKVIVEFSDLGACYVYNPTNPVLNFLRKGVKKIDGISSLKQTWLPMLIDQRETYYGTQYYFQEEGRVTHIGYWTTRMSIWIKEALLKSTDAPIRFNGAVDDKVFREKPVNVEKIPIQTVQPSDSNAVNQGKQNSDDKEQRRNIGGGKKPLTIKKESKIIFGNQCRIISDGQDIYLIDKSIDDCLHLCKITWATSARDSIWVRKPDSSLYREVIYMHGGEIIVIGYIKKRLDYVSFIKSKKDIGDESKKFYLK